MAAALVLFALLDRAGAAVVVAVDGSPVGAVVRCLGAIVLETLKNERQSVGAWEY
jgi:hypothetical protein